MLVSADIRFVNLGIELDKVGKSISVFGIDIAFYGIIIGLAMFCGICVACKEAEKTNQNPEVYLDFALYALVGALIGARVYYVIFQWEYYKKHLDEIIQIRNGGLAIYGGILMAVVIGIIYSKWKKKSLLLLLDTAVSGLALGQAIGRWGNFFNREAYGGYTDGLFAMQIPLEDAGQTIPKHITNHMVEVDGLSYIQVHPTFLYESLWNLVLFLALICFRKYKKFEGERIFWYLAGYGIGRAWIEGLRADQLKLGTVAVSQVLSIILAVFAIGVIVVMRYRISQKKVSKEKI